MTALTQERRAELAALLDDVEAFEAAHPGLADYLRTSEGFPAPDDDQLRVAEEAFELRLLHFLTGGASENPYWEIVGPAVGPGKSHLREVNGRSAAASGRLRYAQGLLQAAYAYAIPSPETVAWIAQIVGDRPLVEIGAGRGYWAQQLSRLGIEVQAYDRDPPAPDSQNTWFPASSGQPSIWHPVSGLRDLARADLAAGRHVDHVLFLCWPPAWGHPMACRALEAYERRGGDRLLYVGETDGRRSATPEFFAALAARWSLLDQDPNHVVWCGLQDVAQCWGRVR